MDYIGYILLFFDDAGSSNAFENLFSVICHRCSPIPVHYLNFIIIAVMRLQNTHCAMYEHYKREHKRIVLCICSGSIKNWEWNEKQYRTAQVAIE